MAGGFVTRLAEAADHDVLTLDNATSFHETVKFTLVVGARIVPLGDLARFLSASPRLVGIEGAKVGAISAAMSNGIGDWLTETEGFEGTLLDPDWWEVRRKRLEELGRPALWCWEEEWQSYQMVMGPNRSAAPIAEGGYRAKRLLKFRRYLTGSS